MSKMYSLILFMFISIASIAAERPRSGRLTITTYDNSDIRVEIDGRRYSTGDNTIRINNINPGYHSVQVYRRQSHNIFGRSGGERLVYSSNIYVKPQHRIDILIDRNGRAQVREQDLDRRRKDRRNDRDNDRWEDYDNWERNNRNDDRWDRNDGGWNNNRPDRSDYGRAVSYETFQSMKQSLRRENFENTRMTLAQQMLSGNYFEASQVREMLQLFSFENNRLELAKHAYRNTTDKKNYYSLYDVFSFSSSKEELSRYISNFR
jgi:hypothetical protein